MSRLRAAINHFPRVKARLRLLRDLVFPFASVSSHYVRVKDTDADRVAARLRAAWQADELPARQRELVNHQLTEYRRGSSVEVFDVMVSILRKLCREGEKASVLEVGCSSGFYSEVFAVAGLPVDYTGCDYSTSFVDLARKSYPGLRFDIEDATALRYPDSAFDVVISGCCLLHIPEYEQAIAETARVAKRYAIFHRTPVVMGEPTKYFRKQAYGVETVEIHFNERELFLIFQQHGLELIETHTLNEERDPANREHGNANRTYVCQKATQ